MTRERKMLLPVLGVVLVTVVSTMQGPRQIPRLDSPRAG